MWSRRAFPLWFAGLFVVAILGHSLIIGAIWAVLGVGYVISLVIHGRSRCLHCNGTGELRGSVFTWAHRRCPRCQGGRIIRWGAGSVGLPHVRQQAQTARQARQNTTTRQRW